MRGRQTGGGGGGEGHSIELSIDYDGGGSEWPRGRLDLRFGSCDGDGRELPNGDIGRKKEFKEKDELWITHSRSPPRCRRPCPSKNVLIPQVIQYVDQLV